MRPLNLGQTLDAAWNLTLRHYGALVSIVLMAAIPIAALSVVINLTTTDVYDIGTSAVDYRDDSGIVPTSEGAYLAGQVAIVLSQSVLFVLATIGCLRVVATGFLGHATGPTESLASVVKKLPQIIWTGLMMLVLVIASVVTIIGPIWLAVSWSFAFAVLLVEGKSGWQALRRSFKLVEGRWWRTAGRLLVGSLIVGIGSGLITAILIEVVKVAVDPRSTAALVGWGVVQLIAWVVTMPFTAALTAIIYFDLRVRKEDLQPAALAAEIGVEGYEAPAFSPPAPSAAAVPSPPLGAPETGGELFGGFAPPAPPDQKT